MAGGVRSTHKLVELRIIEDDAVRLAAVAARIHAVMRSPTREGDFSYFTISSEEADLMRRIVEMSYPLSED